MVRAAPRAPTSLSAARGPWERGRVGGGKGSAAAWCLVAALDSLGYLEERLHAAHGVAPATPEQRGGLHKFNAEDVDPEGGDATADEFLDAFGL